MTNPENYKYTKEHQWLFHEGDLSKVGITSYAIEQLGDVVHIELPSVGKSFKAGETMGTVESTKTVSDIYIPISGTVTEVNTLLIETPEILGEDPYGKGWLIKVRPTEDNNLLMNSQDYENYIKD